MHGTIAPVVARVDPSVFPWPELGGDVAFLDVETSGGASDVNRIVEIGILRISRDGRIRRFASLVDPEGPVLLERVHGLSAAELQGAPTFRDLWPRVAPWLDDVLVIAHQAAFERTWLGRELERLGGTFGASTLCTLEMARRLHPERTGRGAHSLAGLQELYGLPASGHEALADAESLAVLFTRWCATDERTAAAIRELRRPPDAPWAWPDLPGPGAEPLPRHVPAVTGWGRRWLLVASVAVVVAVAVWGYALAQ